MTLRSEHAGRWLRWLWIWVAPLVLPWAALLAVVALPPGAPVPRSALPSEARRADRCTWACHHHGCSHRPWLPATLTADHALFGATIRGLRSLGARMSSDRARGYGLANLLVFCALWPALMYALWVRFWLDRARLRALRAARAASESAS